MPNAKVLSEKKAVVQALAEQMKNATSGVLVDYKGINVADDTKLRRELREAGVEYAVVKNTLMHLAAKEAGLEALDFVLSGTTALATSADMVAPAKILAGFAKKEADANARKPAGDRKKNLFSVKAGFVEGRVISPQEVTTLAELPPREVLVARALAGFNAPITGFVNVLNGNLRGLVVALNAIAEQKGA